MNSRTMKYIVFFSLLVILVLITLGNAFYHKKQFYPSIVYITKSNTSMAIIYFVVSNVLWLAGYWMIYAFFGQLRAAENEEFWERMKYIATETCMAFAVFRDDFSPMFAGLFAILLYLKILHWLAEERVDYMERSPVISKLFHFRIVSILLLLGCVDVTFVVYACKSIMTKGASPFIAFGFEYAILMPTVLFITLKYLLHTIEIRRETPLVDKTIVFIYGQIVFDFVKMLLFFSYLTAMFRIYLLPAFAFRQMFNTVRGFGTAVNDVISFRRAVRYMNKYCPTATKEELEATDTVCIVCREDMNSGAKKLPCNHIFHSACLRSWFQRQQTCPTCRLKILNPIVSIPINQEQQRQGPPLVQPNQYPQPPQQHHSNIQHPEAQSNERLTELKQDPNASLVNKKLSFDSSQYPGPNEPHFPPPLPPDFPESSLTLYHNVPWNDLSRQNLIEMERETREGIEYRIKYLHNMMKMLDSTIVMMHTFCNLPPIQPPIDIHEAPIQEIEEVRQLDSAPSISEDRETRENTSERLQVASHLEE